MSYTQDFSCSLSFMTDVKKAGRRGPGRRGIPLRLESNVLELIAAGHDDLLDGDGEPIPARIAKAAGIHRQRLSPTVAWEDSHTMGALVDCYARLHGVSEKQALAALVGLSRDKAVAT